MCVGVTMNQPTPITGPGYPALKDFIGREAELARYHQQLNHRNIAIIKGLSGSGKSFCGAKLLAQQNHCRKFWWPLRETFNDTLELAAWDVGSLLVKGRNPAAFRYLRQQSRLTRPFPVRIRLDRVLDELSKSPTILCVDNYEVIDTNRAMRSFMEEIRDRIENRPKSQLKLIVTSTVDPLFLYDFGNTPLLGFSLAEMRLFLERRGITLSEAESAFLWTETDGVPKLIQQFTGQETVGEFIDALTFDPSWQSFQVQGRQEIVDVLERKLMEILSIFKYPVTYPGLREEICVAEDNITNIGDVLAHLLRRYLVMRVPEVRQGVILPKVLQHFYASQVALSLRTRIHRRAVEYYSRQANRDAAAYHQRQLGQIA